MTTTPILALPYFAREFVSESVASGVVLGAILIHKGLPIAYFSKALSERILAKSSYFSKVLSKRIQAKLAYEKMMAMALDIQHW